MALGTPVHVAGVASDLTQGGYALFDVALTAGQYVRLTVASYASAENIAAPSAVVDSDGVNVWTHEQRILATGANQPTLSVWSCRAVATTSVRVDLTYPLTQRGCVVSIDAYPGASPAAPTRPDTLVCSQGTAGTSGTSTLPKAMAAAAHLHVCAVAHQANSATTVGAGFTALSDAGVTDAGDSTACRLAVMYKANDTTCDPSWTTSSAWAFASAEVQEVVTTAAVEQTPFAPVWLVEVAP